MAVQQVPTGSPGRSGSGGREISGYALRGVLALATAALVLTTLVSSDGVGFGPVPVVLALVAAGAVAAFPASPAPMTVSCIVIVLYATSVPGFGPVAVVIASLLHSAHVLAGLAEVVPARARVEPGALLSTFRRWWRVQMVLLPVLVILALLLP